MGPVINLPRTGGTLLEIPTERGLKTAHKTSPYMLASIEHLLVLKVGCEKGSPGPEQKGSEHLMSLWLGFFARSFWGF